MDVETTRRLETISAGLADRLRNASEEQLRQLATAVADLAVRSVGLHDPRLERAVEAQRSEGAERLSLRTAVESLVAELDNVYWDLQKQAEADHTKEEEYLEAFARARAASAVGFALDPDPLVAASEAIYEANAATQDLDAIRCVVAEVIGD